MTLISKLFHPAGNRKYPSVDALFTYLRSLINREDLIERLWQKYTAAASLPERSRDAIYAGLYSDFETFIVGHTPLVVKQSFTALELRDAVRTAISTVSLPILVRVWFEEGDVIDIVRFQIYTQEMVSELCRLEGEAKVLGIVRTFLGPSAGLRHMDDTDTFLIMFVRPEEEVQSVLRQKFHTCFTQLYTESVSLFGEYKASRIIIDTYQQLEKTKNHDLLADFFTYIPSHLLQTERLAYLSAEDLAKRVAEATSREIRKKEEAESLSRELESKIQELQKQYETMESTKRAMLNLLEDAKSLEEQLKIEKASVEQKVKDRTAQLREEQVRMTASVSSLPVGFVMVDESHAVLFHNKKALDILGIHQEIKKLDDLLNVFPKDSVVHELLSTYQAEHESKGVKGEVSYGPKTLMISFLPVINESDVEAKNLGSIVLIDDITEAKVLARSRDEFFSIASHELRTPLTAIRGNTSMILEYHADKLTDPDLKEMITDVHDSSIRLIDIVNDFLESSRLEQGRLEFKNAPFDISDLIERALKEYQVTGSRSHIALSYAQPEVPLPLVFADADRVRQVLINLIGNGIKFVEQGSVTVTAHVNGGQVEIMVTDTGRGIPIANQSLLFRKFQQAGDSLMTRDTTKGTGLGLYISKLMIEGMGGKIWLVSSEVNHGTTFAFTLPVAPIA